MLRIQYALFAIMAAATLGACTKEAEQQAQTPVVAATYDMTADFSAYHTFDVIEREDVPADQVSPSSLLDVNRIAIMDSIVKEMEDRGYVRDQDSPDLEIVPFVRLKEVEVAVDSAYWYDYYYGWYWGYAYPWYTQDLVTLESGTLIIDAVDVGDRDDQDDDLLVFRGTATELLPDTPTDVSAQIPKAVADIFSYWPEQPKT